jgi:hypothetical protein
MGQFIPLAQEFEDSLLIVGATMCVASLAFSGRQKMGMLGTGAFLVVATLIVTILTFKSAIPG